MRLLWIFVLSAAIVLLTMTVGIGAVLLLDDREPWVLLLTLVCVMLLIAIPSLAGIMVANFMFDIEKPDGRRFLRRFVLVITGIQLLGVIGLAFIAVAVPEAIVFLLGIVALSVGLHIGATRLGISLHKRTANESLNAKGWSPWSPTVIRSKAMRVVVVFTIATVITVGALTGLFILAEDDGTSHFAPIVYGVSFGFISASVACLVVAWPLVKDLRHALGWDYATQKAIGRVVLRNKKEYLSSDSERRAAAYAGIMAVYLPFQTAQIVLLFAGLWVQQLWNLIDQASTVYSWLTTGMVIGCPVLLAATLPFMIRQVRNAKRYALEHADLITTDGTDRGVA